MDFLVQPIYLSDSQFHCISPSTKRTDFVLDGDAATFGAGVMLFECPDLSPVQPIASTDKAESTRDYTGSMEFAVSCGVSAIEIAIDSGMETKGDGVDFTKVYVNGSLYHTWESVQETYANISTDYPSAAGYGTFDEGGGVYTRPYEVATLEDTITIPLTGIPCGNKISIVGSTFDSIANNGTYSFIEVTVNP